MTVPLAEGDLLTVPQVQRLLPVGRSTVYALVATGLIPGIRVPTAGGGRGRLLIHRDDLSEFVARARQAATRAPTRPDVDALLRKVRGGRA